MCIQRSLGMKCACFALFTASHGKQFGLSQSAIKVMKDRNSQKTRTPCKLPPLFATKVILYATRPFLLGYITLIVFFLIEARE